MNTTTTSALPPGRQATMPFIMRVVLIDMVLIGLIIPVLAPLVGTFTSSPSEQAVWYGAVTIAFGIANFFGSPILGRLIEHYGRRPVLMIGFSGLALSFFVTGAAAALWMLLAVRLFSGAMQSNITVANACVADITAPADRARAFGKLGAMIGLGFILGPVIGGLQGGISLHLPLFVAGGLAIVNWLYGFFVLPESLPPERRQPFVLREANGVAARADRAQGCRAAGGGGRPERPGAVRDPHHMGGATRAAGPAAEALLGAAPGRDGAGLVECVLRALGPGHRELNDVRGDHRQRARLRHLGGDPVPYLQGRRPDDAVTHRRRRRLAEQHDGGAGAGYRRTAAGAGVAPAQGDWRIGAPFYFCALLQAASVVIALRHFRRQRRVAAVPTAMLAGSTN